MNSHPPILIIASDIIYVVSTLLKLDECTEKPKSEKGNGIYEGVGEAHTPIYTLFPAGGCFFQ